MASMRRVVGAGVTAGAALTAVVGAGVAVAMPAGVHGPGAMLAELQGHTATSGYASASAAPRDLVPGWARSAGSGVTVVRPGDAAGDEGGSVRVDFSLDAGTPLPADCTALPQVGMPWDGGGSWPDLGSAAQLCDGWVTVVLDDHLYAWTADDLRS